MAAGRPRQLHTRRRRGGAAVTVRALEVGAIRAGRGRVDVARAEANPTVGAPVVAAFVALWDRRPAREGA